ncbi:FecR family protein, partial [Chitinophaga sp.]|uniref:FecR family protein n=1 Tax=Chitinophaga sp. TaxID=1869181 RepID=UPI002BEA5E1B
MNFQDFEAADFACDESFQRYCLEENDTDILFWEGWIARHPEKAAAVQEARYMIGVLSARQGSRLEQLKHLKDGIARYDLLHMALEEQPEQTIASSGKRISSLFKYAAVLAGIVMLAGAIYLFSQHNTPADITSPKTSIVINAGNDPRKTVVLPDGSSIVLRKNSSVELAAGFNEANRKLTLTGEAFFDVTQHAQYPFIVHTAAFDIKVLGTVFNVSAYAGSHEAETALFKGKVEVTLADKREEKIILQPNQKLTTNAVTLPTRATPFKIVPLDADPVNHKAREIAWVRNRLEIENEPLESIAGKLEKWYGIRVTFADETVKHYRYSGTFESETILKALDALQ